MLRRAARVALASTADDRGEMASRQLLAYTFGSDSRFEGQLVGALERIESGGAMRVLDALFVAREPDSGELSAFSLAARGGSGAVGAVSELLDFRLNAGGRAGSTRRALEGPAGETVRSIGEGLRARGGVRRGAGRAHLGGGAGRRGLADRWDRGRGGVRRRRWVGGGRRAVGRARPGRGLTSGGEPGVPGKTFPSAREASSVTNFPLAGHNVPLDEWLAPSGTKSAGPGAPRGHRKAPHKQGFSQRAR